MNSPWAALKSWPWLGREETLGLLLRSLACAFVSSVAYLDWGGAGSLAPGIAFAALLIGPQLEFRWGVMALAVLAFGANMAAGDIESTKWLMDISPSLVGALGLALVLGLAKILTPKQALAYFVAGALLGLAFSGVLAVAGKFLPKNPLHSTLEGSLGIDPVTMVWQVFYGLWVWQFPMAYLLSMFVESRRKDGESAA